MQAQIDKTESGMQKSIQALQNDFSTIRAGRAQPALLNRIMVDYYGTPTPIPQMAAVSVQEARALVIQPWDVSMLKAIEKAIQTSDLGINPTNDGKVIRLAFPQPTEERRKELVKSVRQMAEKAKVAIRSHRHDGLDKLKAMKKNGEITEDDLKNGEKKIQNLTDKYCKEVDSMSAAKEKEVLSL